MTDVEREARSAIVEVYGELARRGLNFSSAGNVSVRHGAGMLITPSGCTEEWLAPEMIVETSLDGAHAGAFSPSVEWAMHAEVYRHLPEAGAVVHTHADNCVALACLHRPLPAFHYMIHGFGGTDVPLVPYLPFGSRALAEAAAMALTDRTACLLANHGMLARGATLRAALETTVRLEVLARQYLLALSAGEPCLLEGDDLAALPEHYANYARQKRPALALPWMVPKS